MKFSICNREVSSSSVVVSEMGFGQPFSASEPWVHDFEAEISVDMFVERMSVAYAEFVNEAKIEEQTEGESDPEFLGELGYPELRQLIDKHPHEFATLLLEYLYGVFSETCFTNSVDSPNFGYVVNSFSDVTVNGSLIIVTGVLYERRGEIMS